MQSQFIMYSFKSKDFRQEVPANTPVNAREAFLSDFQAPNAQNILRKKILPRSWEASSLIRSDAVNAMKTRPPRLHSESKNSRG